MRTLLVILTFTRQDLIERYSGSILGGLWSLMMPLVNILIYTIVFSKIMGARLNLPGMEDSPYNYSLYLISAMLAWNCFAATVTRTTSLYHEKAGIITKVHIGLRALPMYILLSESVIYAISMSIFLLFAIAVDHPPGWAILTLPAVFLLQQMIAYSLGLLCATFAVFIRDTRELISILFHVWFWFTPIIYVVEILPQGWGQLLAYNPARYFVDAYRQIILANEVPDLQFFAIAAITAFALAKLALFVNRRLQSDIRDFI